MDLSEREEFRAYVAARGAALLRTAVLITGDRALAEDLVQTALILCVVMLLEQHPLPRDATARELR